MFGTENPVNFSYVMGSQRKEPRTKIHGILIIDNWREET